MNRQTFKGDRRASTLRTCLVAAMAGAGLAAIVATAAQADDMKVPVNSSRPLTLTSPAATVLLSNPRVADINVQSSTLVYILGKNHGQTDLIALDKDGKQILNLAINITAPDEGIVTLTRGTGQYTYNCAPRCEAVAAQGDDVPRFDNLMKQAGALTGAANAMAQQSSPANNE
ncbi:hypothetical protein FHS78_001043 [Parvibaculum indicum]|uniref:pilus assembly protein N-terminal domain-containing protein n=1 Tax=Parvibaculum indicum TaxID=562969 RepID=UPI0014246F14|nr:pilus assembly protein N-terminal domain-containing protein [Parvibaculum indicum]NIJ40767.1 hypothetical protein [Parvibaculum indicum]